MERRKTFLPPDLQHEIDGACADGGISAMAQTTLCLYGETSVIDRIHEGEIGAFRIKRYRLKPREMNFQIEEYAASIVRQLPAGRRAVLVEQGVMSLIRNVRAKAEWLSDSFYEDATRGGHFCQYIDNAHLDADMLPTPKLARRLRSRGRIDRYVDMADAEGIAHQRALLKIILGTGPYALATQADRDELFADLDGQLESHQILARQAIAEARWVEEMRADVAGDGLVDALPPEIRVKLKPAYRRKQREAMKARRKATKRAAAFAAALLGASAVSAFAKGERVDIVAPEVTFSARLKGSIAAVGHGALEIGVHGFDGVRIAKLCLYQDAPALDQLASLALHASAGVESQVLEAGNFYDIEDPGHPVLDNKKIRRPIPDGPEPIAVRHARHGQRFDDGKAAYAKEKRAVYEDIIAQKVFGRAAKVLFHNPSLMRNV